MKNILKATFAFFLILTINLSYAKQDPKVSKDKKTTTSSDPGKKKDKNGVSEKSGAKKSSDKASSKK